LLLTGGKIVGFQKGDVNKFRFMRKKSFEEKQLTLNMIELSILSDSIIKELDSIYGELEKKGKWNEFVENLEKIPAKEDSYLLTEAIPENYYECLLLSLTVIDRYDEFKCKAESAQREDKLRNLDNRKLPDELLQILRNLGISSAQETDIQPGNTESPQDKICVLYLNSKILIPGLQKALVTIKESKSFIFLKF
jgi:hypothetical protein